MTARRTYLLLLVIAVLLAVLIWFYPSNTDFKDENPHWNGSRDILADFEAVPLLSYDALPIDGQRSPAIECFVWTRMLRVYP